MSSKWQVEIGTRQSGSRNPALSSSSKSKSAKTFISVILGFQRQNSLLLIFNFLFAPFPKGKAGSTKRKQSGQMAGQLCRELRELEGKSWSQSDCAQGLPGPVLAPTEGRYTGVPS